MKRFFCLFLFLILLAAVSIQKEGKPKGTEEKTFSGDPIEFTCKRPNSDDDILLKAIIPKGWKVNPDFGTVVYQPANADDFFEPPSIEFQATCAGECKAEAIPKNVELYIQRLKEGWKKLSTGNPDLDKLGANVEIIKEEKSEGQWLFEVKLTYPEGVSNSMYPPRYWIYRFLHKAQDPFFIIISGKVPVNLADRFLFDVESACLNTTKP